MAVSKTEIQRRMEQFERMCRQHGLKVTHQRTEIFRELAGTDEHPDAETIYAAVHQRVPAVSLDTVYRTLGVLEEKGLIRRAEVQSGAARYDANTDRHHHFICTACGLVRDIHYEQIENVPIPASVQEIGTVESRDIQLRGLCKRCAARKRA
jgi:Fur family transcriptional regulator, peroxide stress response regulator